MQALTITTALAIICSGAVTGCASAPQTSQTPPAPAASRAAQLDRLTVADAGASAPTAVPAGPAVDPATRDLALKALTYPLLLSRNARTGRALPLNGTPALKPD
ncbi:hypothetical protein [Coralloluteibacterium stylophorae]|uniref:Uncharacterized protein n=1 Tax=Coralloluteibacterium stylophorae TaxID=1776034 RepID=A0A8J7VXI9_9GAMM|nr:hypothetical protein [Coralloluteibacterium stylophorae]MBS7456751.1 hypothetical protein [Coralloluteibacterium stylophorae]